MCVHIEHWTEQSLMNSHAPYLLHSSVSCPKTEAAPLNTAHTLQTTSKHFWWTYTYTFLICVYAFMCSGSCAHWALARGGLEGFSLGTLYLLFAWDRQGRRRCLASKLQRFTFLYFFSAGVTKDAYTPSYSASVLRLELDASMPRYLAWVLRLELVCPSTSLNQLPSPILGHLNLTKSPHKVPRYLLSLPMHS